MTTLTIRPEAIDRANQAVSQIQNKILDELKAELQELTSRKNAKDCQDEISVIRAMIARLEKLHNRSNA